jgi:hypothetical protein
MIFIYACFGFSERTLFAPPHKIALLLMPTAREIPNKTINNNQGCLPRRFLDGDVFLAAPGLAFATLFSSGLTL